MHCLKSRAPLLLAALPVFALAALPLPAQQLEARRVTAPPTIDGRTDDAAWAGAAVASGFSVFRPTEGADPTYRTEVRAVFDSRTLFVLVRAFDPHPESIVGLLSRRDNFGPPSDLIQLYVDSYHDGRNGYEYVVNPAGVKSDFVLYDDDRFDVSWDGIWDVATRVDSAGWVAEFAIPFSQLRFRGGAESTFGIMVWRTVGRMGERSSWPRYRPSVAGLVSQFTLLHGLTDLPSRARLEVAPYLLSHVRNVPRGAGVPVEVEAQLTGGADLKFGPSPNITVDATVNPDFGQLEADPAVLNLGAFETFLPERRPFFLEGAGLFRFTLSRDPNSPESLFYTRRIGRRPLLADTFGDIDSPNETTILGAAKLTGRFGGRTSLASLATVTAEELGAPSPAGGRYVVEPRTGYSVTRVQRDYRNGRSGVGVMLTGVQRQLDATARSFLPRQALGGGFATHHQSTNGQYFGRLWIAATQLTGTSAAISRVQLSSIHAFQRPDDHNVFDSTRTSLSGTAGQIWVGKIGGVARYGMSYRHLSPGFDPTDIGFINEANHRSWVMDVGLQSTRASSWYRNAGVSLVHIHWWSGSGQIDRTLFLNASAELLSQWRVTVGASQAQLPGTYCSQKCTRGGPALRKDPLSSVSLQLTGDPRARLSPDVFVGWQADDGGRSRVVRVTPSLLWRAASNLQVSASTTIEELANDTQFYRRFGAAASDTTHYTLARLVQGTRALTTRVSYAATPSLSVEWYAQPYLAKGRFSNVRELNAPRAPDYDQRLRPYADPAVTSAPGGVNFEQFRSNLVTRWEFRPGSVLFVVWSQGRDLRTAESVDLNLSRNAQELFALQPKNTIAIKASYWFGR